MREINDPINGSNARAKFKQRIVGGAVLLIVLAVFLPFIFRHSHSAAPTIEQNVTVQPAANATQAADQPAAVATPASLDETTPAAPQQIKTTTQAQPDLANQTESSLRSDQPGLTSTQSESSASTPSTVSAPPPATPKQPPIQPQTQQTQLQTKGRWIVQVGSFSQAEYARRLVIRLRAHGLPAYTQQNTKQLTRVYVGPLASEQQAQKVQQKVQTEFQLSSLIKQEKKA